MQGGGRKDRAQLCRKGLAGTGGWQAGHKPAMCHHGPESPLYPRLHQENRGQQGEGGDLPLCSVHCDSVTLKHNSIYRCNP